VRLAFFALLFANLAYFAWSHWVDAPRPPPVNDAIAHLPRLKMADELPPAERPKPHTAQKTALQESLACLSVGPFGDLANGAQAAALLKAKGFDPRQRAEQGQSSDGYWVYVSGLASLAEVDQALVTLEHSAVKDARVMPATAGVGPRISLGLYSERSRAERRAQTVRAAGLKAEIAERKLPGTLYWVDLTPPPGMGPIPLQDLFAEGINSKISVQPCPASTGPAPAAGTGTAGTSTPAPPGPPTTSTPLPVAAVGTPKLP
jgi:hypothetical protein